MDRWIFSLCGGKPLHWVLGWVDFASKEYAIFDGLPELNSSAWAIPVSGRQEIRIILLTVIWLASFWSKQSTIFTHTWRETRSGSRKIRLGKVECMDRRRCRDKSTTGHVVYMIWWPWEHVRQERILWMSRMRRKTRCGSRSWRPYSLFRSSNSLKLNITS